MKSTAEIIRTEKIMRYAISAMVKDFERSFELIPMLQSNKKPYKRYQIRETTWKKWIKKWIDDPYIKSKNYWDEIKNK